MNLFGGEDEFQKRLVNDEKKRKKCRENNVLLIEWPYTDKVSEGTLKTKFEDLGIVVPHTEKFEISTEENKCSIKLTRPNDKAIKFLEQALTKDNLAKMLYYIKKMVANNNRKEIKRTLCNAIINFSEDAAIDFFKIILRYDVPAIYQAICSDEKLLDFWASTGILNFYGRKIIFTLANENPTSERAAKYLKKYGLSKRRKVSIQMYGLLTIL